MKSAVLMSIALGLAAGCIYGDERRRRINAEECYHELEGMLQKLSPNKSQLQPTLAR